MSKIKIKLKLQGLELEVEGDREDIPAITRGIKQQLGDIIQAPANVIGIEAQVERPVTPVISVGNGSPEPKVRKRRSRSSGSGEETGSLAVDFRHDGAVYGIPKQEWTTQQKAMWLLYVVEKQTESKELSAGSVHATFNKHFRQAKEINRGNTLRDLGGAKLKTPSLVGEDTTKSPSLWYLTEEGKKSVQKLISDQGIVAAV